MGVLNLEQVKIPFPVWTFLIQRCVAVADLHPLHAAVRELARLLHVAPVFVAGNGAAPEGIVFDGTIERLLLPFLYFSRYEITHDFSYAGGLRNRPDITAFPRTWPCIAAKTFSRVCNSSLGLGVAVAATGLVTAGIESSLMSRA